jgi:hypothetical protein
VDLPSAANTVAAASASTVNREWPCAAWKQQQQQLQSPQNSPGDTLLAAAVGTVFNSAGPIAVKAAIWTVVEQMYARNISLLYAGPVSSLSEVCVACWPGQQC